MAVTLKKQETKERQRQTIALLLSITISLCTILILYLIKINFFEYPPADFEYGMQVSYGTDDAGSGESAVPIQDFINTENNADNQNDQSSTENVESAEESPISETKVNTNKIENTKPSNKPNNEQNQSPPKKVTKTDDKPAKDGQGNDPNQTGNKGKENGINQQGLYEGNGGNGGSSLSLSGWRWEAEPIVQENSNVEGTIIFDVLADANGEFIYVKPRYPGTTVTDRDLIEKYRKAVLTAILVSDGSKTASQARGIVTYVLKSK